MEKFVWYSTCLGYEFEMLHTELMWNLITKPLIQAYTNVQNFQHSFFFHSGGGARKLANKSANRIAKKRGRIIKCCGRNSCLSPSQHHAGSGKDRSHTKLAGSSHNGTAAASSKGNQPAVNIIRISPMENVN